MKKITLLFSLSLLMILGACNPEKSDAPTTPAKPVQTDAEIALAKQSKETMDIAMKYMEAMGKGDMETMMSLMDDNMVWHNEGDKSMPWIGPWKGKKVILEEFMPLFGENFKTLKWETKDAMSSGNTAAFFGRMVGLATKTDQKTDEFTFALRVKVANGKIVLWNWFEDSYDVSQAYHGLKK